MTSAIVEIITEHTHASDHFKCRLNKFNYKGREYMYDLDHHCLIPRIFFNSQYPDLDHLVGKYYRNPPVILEDEVPHLNET